MTSQEIATAIQAVASIGRMIRDAKRIPSGHLYAQLMGHLSLDKYELAIRLLKQESLIAEKSNELIWIAD